MRFVFLGLPYKHIAKQLGITRETVARHTTNATDKLPLTTGGLNRKTALALHYLQNFVTAEQVLRWLNSSEGAKVQAACLNIRARRKTLARILDIIMEQPGVNRREIAEQLGIKTTTAGSRLSDMYTLLGVSNFTRLTVVCYMTRYAHEP